MSTDAHSQHTDHEHQHGADCGHEAVQHGDHVDYLHDDHRHAVHDDHYDEHNELDESNQLEGRFREDIEAMLSDHTWSARTPTLHASTSGPSG